MGIERDDRAENQVVSRTLTPNRAIERTVQQRRYACCCPPAHCERWAS